MAEWLERSTRLYKVGGSNPAGLAERAHFSKLRSFCLRFIQSIFYDVGPSEKKGERSVNTF